MKKKNYEREKKTALTGIIFSSICAVLGAVFILAGAALFIEAKALDLESQSRTEEFDPQSSESQGSSWKTMQLQTLTYDFAEDFKGTYHYYIGFTEYGEVRILKMKGELAPEFTPYVEYWMSDEKSEIPEPMEVRGTSAVMEEDIREFAMDTLNYIFGYEYVTEENAKKIIGTHYLDLTEKPTGGGNKAGGCTFLGVGSVMLICGILALFLTVKKRQAAVLGMEKERQALGIAHTYKNPEQESEDTAGTFIAAEDYGSLCPPQEPENPLEEVIYENRNEEKTTGNVFLGILGAAGGSLIGVLLWILIGYAGFIAGIAGFIMLKLALTGYQKCSGNLGRKGALFCLFLTIFMIFAANVLEFGIIICRALFEYEASMDTVRYVAANYMELMSRGELWPGFFKNLLVGYGLFIWASSRLIGAILKYRDGE